MTNVESTAKRVTKRTLYGTTCGIIVISLLALAGTTSGRQVDFSPVPDAERSQATGRRLYCSNGTLAGSYAVRSSGFVPGGPPPAPLVPFATVSLMTLDGYGSLTNAVTTSTNAVITSSVNPGTYSVNGDCTGKMSINIPAPPFLLNFDFVIADRGGEFHAIATTPSVVTVAGKRVQ